ncbi:MFS transporter [Gordonia alkanivorans]|nr:MFS transporter [Gordonia alkanivorans]MDH3047139.1 MFS transporter [Gordonia alkanivorans]
MVTASVANDALEDWAWRIPFLLSLPLGLLCLWMRVRLEESVEFTELASEDTTEKAPLWESLRSAPMAMLRVAAYTFSLTTVGHIVMVYVSVLLIQQLGYEKQTVYWLTAVVIGLGAMSAPMFGAWSDKVGRRPLMIGAPIATIVLAVPLFLVLTTSTNLFLAGLVFLALMVLCQAYSPGYTVFVESFPTRIRYTASAFGYNAGIMLSGFAPALSAGLVDRTGSLVSPAWLAVAAAVIGVMAALSLRDRSSGS